ARRARPPATTNRHAPHRRGSEGADRANSAKHAELSARPGAVSASAAAICDAKQCRHHKDLPCHTTVARSGVFVREFLGSFDGVGQGLRFFAYRLETSNTAYPRSSWLAGTTHSPLADIRMCRRFGH